MLVSQSSTLSDSLSKLAKLASAEVLPAAVQQVREVIQSTIEVAKSGDLKLDLGSLEVRGTLQFLKNIATVTEFSELKQDLLRLVKSGLHKTETQNLFVSLLTGLSQLNSAIAKDAKHQLAVLRGEAGNVSELVQASLQRFSDPKAHLSLVGALSLATTGGKLARLFLGRAINRVGLTAGKALLARGGAAAGTIGVESSLFPVGHTMAASAMGGEFSLNHFNEEAVHGFKVMSVLGVMGMLSRGAYHAVHGVSAAGRVTRFHRAAAWSQKAFHLTGEFSGLLGLSRYENSNALWLHSVLGTGETMFSLRVAHGLGNTALPRLHHGLKVLDAKTHFEARISLWRRVQASRSRLESFLNPPTGGSGTAGLRWATQSSGAASVSAATKPGRRNYVAELGLDKMLMTIPDAGEGGFGTSSKDPLAGEIADLDLMSTQEFLARVLMAKEPVEVVVGNVMALGLRSFDTPGERSQITRQFADMTRSVFEIWSMQSSPNESFEALEIELKERVLGLRDISVEQALLVGEQVEQLWSTWYRFAPTELLSSVGEILPLTKVREGWLDEAPGRAVFVRAVKGLHELVEQNRENPESPDMGWLTDPGASHAASNIEGFANSGVGELIFTIPPESMKFLAPHVGGRQLVSAVNEILNSNPNNRNDERGFSHLTDNQRLSLKSYFREHTAKEQQAIVEELRELQGSRDVFVDGELATGLADYFDSLRPAPPGFSN